MDLMTKKEIITTIVTKLEKSNMREENLKKELANDMATLDKVDSMMDNGDPLPTDTGYQSFLQWKEAIEKQIDTGNRSLAKIEEQKVEAEALNFFLINAAE